MAICSGCQGQHIFSHTSHIFHYYLNLQYIQLGALTIFLPVCFTGRPQAPLTGGHMTLPENLDGNELTGIYCC
ncbi:hypothetical protein AAC387_Pa01g0851 [Persea americana]